MSTVRIVIDGIAKLTQEKYNSLRDVLLDVAQTQNVGSKTVQDAVQKIGNPAATADLLLSVFPAESVVEVYETPKGQAERLAARYPLGNLCKRLVIAGTADEFSGEIFTVGKKAEPKSETPQTFTIDPDDLG